MKANELMIDDWVYNKNIDKPMQVYPMMLSQMFRQTPDATTEDYNIFPIPITPEILEKNGFKRDAFTNLSPDFFYEDDACSVSINLNSTCDKCKSIWVENRNLRITASIEESRHSLQKNPLLLHQLQHALRLCGIEKEIIL